MTPVRRKESDTLDLTREQIVELLDREAQRRLGKPWQELVKLYRVGKLEDCGQFADLLALANLLTNDDPLFAAA
jgi:hypothetical protein